jgi:hypothetical protein
VIIVKKDFAEGVDSNVSDAEILTQKHDSAEAEYSNDTQVKHKMPDFVISSDQMPC